MDTAIRLWGFGAVLLALLDPLAPPAAGQDRPAGNDPNDWVSVAVKGFGFPGVTMPPGNWVAPAGSYRSGGGGNEAVGAFETTGRQAVRRSGRP